LTNLKNLTMNPIGRKVSAVAILGFAALLLAACNGQPTLVVMQITNTPDPRMIQITVTNTGNAPTVVNAVPTVVSNLPTQPAVIPTNGPLFTPSASPQPTTPSGSPSLSSTLVPATAIPTAAAPAVNPTQSLIPIGTSIPIATDTRTQMYIAQEDFQHGYMFWISSVTQIWVLLPADDTPPDQPPSHGQWQIFQDNFKDGQPEIDPSIVPPTSNLYQPRRGFGLLWRSNNFVRGTLGFGTTPEFGLTTSYVYQPGPYVTTTPGQLSLSAGTHFLVNLSRQTIAFHEPQPGQQFGTWEKVG
jgi:hypothetical protein